MAKAKAAAKSARPARAGGGAWLLIGLGLAAGVLMSYALPTGMMLALGLLPSGLAWMLDATPGRPGARAVLFLNLAGLAPALAELWRGGHGLSASLALLADWRTLGLAWAGAAAGLLLKTLLPLASGYSVDAQSAARRAALESRRAALVEQWGEPEDYSSRSTS